MKTNQLPLRFLAVIISTFVFFWISQSLSYAASKKKKKKYVMTEVELQSELMSYADRFASIISNAFEDYDALKPEPQARQVLLGDLVYSISSVYTIAAEPNPQVGLLDMVAVTTLGRLIYEDNMRRKYGKSTEILAAGFRQLEKDIWSVSAKVLASEQREELRQLILLWRKNNPEKVVYNYLRFSDFAAQRRNSTLVKKVQGGGLFKTVKQVTQQVEETRMLAERGIFLGTRLPLLTGNFAEVWMSQLLGSPETNKILTDIHTFSTVSERLAIVAEQMPNKVMKDVSKIQKQTVNQVMKEIDEWSEKTLNDVFARVAIERGAFIGQFMDRLIGEQKIALEAIMLEEQQVTGLVTELRKVIEGSNTLLMTANTLSEKFMTGEPAAEPKESKPFDIKEYQDAIVEVTALVDSTNRLFGTVGLEELLPQLVKAIDQVGNKSEQVVDHSFRQALILILIAMGAYVVARLIYNYLNLKLIKSRA
ncbi:hypothetical protein D1AOALGA4SA_12681 [Olavius algarvensis Delta 1 endosymbiont]|nr:hypothetical protein D1AOALGA4SA_12681 [Olavius algarvensis Delta 1 endosymbiont]